MDLGWWVGFIGGILLAIAYLPQAKRVWDNRNEGLKDISPTWLVVGGIGTVLMLWYAFIIEQPSMVILNSIVTAVYVFMFYLLKRRRNKNE